MAYSTSRRSSSTLSKPGSTSESTNRLGNHGGRNPDERFDKTDLEITAVETRLNERFDKTDLDIKTVETRLNERLDRTDEAIVKVREDVAEVKGKMDLMVTIATKTENERMAEAIIAVESGRAAAVRE